jgi:hypothetical protein
MLSKILNNELLVLASTEKNSQGKRKIHPLQTPRHPGIQAPGQAHQ